MRAARVSTALVSTALVTGCLAALVLAPAALAAPGSVPPPSTSTTTAGTTRAAAGTSASGAAGSTTSPSTTSPSSTSPEPGSPAASPPARAASVAPPCSTDPTADHPVICLPPDSGEDHVGFVPAGESIEFGAQIVNGGASASNAKIVISLPPTLRVFPDDPPVRIDDWFPLDSSAGESTDLRCTRSPDFRTVVCDVGTLAPGANVLVGIPLYAPTDAPDGQRAAFSVTLQPSGASSFAPSGVSATVQFLGAAHVRTTLNPTHLTVTLGRTGTLTATMHNLGRAAALGTAGLAVVQPTSGESPHFLITDSPVDVTDDRSITPALLHRRSLLARQFLAAQQAARPGRPARSSHPAPVGFWPIGTIAAGGTARVPVSVRAVGVGSDTLTFGALSLTDPGICNADGSVCDEVATARLTAVRAASPTGGRHEPLAATGTRVGTGWVQAAALLVALGALLVVLGRPVRSRRRR